MGASTKWYLNALYPDYFVKNPTYSPPSPGLQAFAKLDKYKELCIGEQKMATPPEPSSTGCSGWGRDHLKICLYALVEPDKKLATRDRLRLRQKTIVSCETKRPPRKARLTVIKRHFQNARMRGIR